MSTSQIPSERSISQIPCSHCSKTYEPYKSPKGLPSKVCPTCREAQQRAEAKRKEKGRIRNYQEEAKRNLEHTWKDFCRRNIEKRGKEVTITQDDFHTLIHQSCSFCGYFNQNEVVGIDRLDNNKGYIQGNCVPACKFCNRVKHILHHEFFVEKAKLITRNQLNILSDSERDSFYNTWKEYIHKVPVPYKYIKRQTEEKRGLPFHITKEQYEEIIYKPCYLCGLRNRHGNGLDRIDNTRREYSIENVLPCCSTCNMMKAHFEKEEFLRGVQKISEYRQAIPEEWKTVPRQGFHMGGARTEKEQGPEKEKQWRAKTIYKAVKAGTTSDFQTKVLEQTKWSVEEFQKQTEVLFQRIQTASFKETEDDLKSLVTKIRYIRLGRK